MTDWIITICTIIVTAITVIDHREKQKKEKPPEDE